MNYIDDNINVQDYNNVNSRKASMNNTGGMSRHANMTQQSSNSTTGGQGHHRGNISKTSLDHNNGQYSFYQ
jgi:hypothetical protein